MSHSLNHLGDVLTELREFPAARKAIEEGWQSVERFRPKMNSMLRRVLTAWESFSANWVNLLPLGMCWKRPWRSAARNYRKATKHWLAS